MEKQQFKKFCQKEFEFYGFKKKKNKFYLNGVDLLCRIDLQKSYYGEVYFAKTGSGLFFDFKSGDCKKKTGSIV